MGKSLQKHQCQDVKHYLLALSFVFSCLLLSGCSDDDPVSRASQDVGASLLPGGGIQINLALTLDLNKELNWYKILITDDAKVMAVQNVSAVLEGGQMLETTLEADGNYVHARVHFKPPRTGSVKFTIVYSSENAVCKIEDTVLQKLRLSWFGEYEHELLKSTFRLRAAVGSPKLEGACFGEETAGELECLADEPSESGEDAVTHSAFSNGGRKVLEPAFQWSIPVVSERACSGTGFPAWIPLTIAMIGILLFFCCGWYVVLFRSSGVQQRYPRLHAALRCQCLVTHH